MEEISEEISDTHGYRRVSWTWAAPFKQEISDTHEYRRVSWTWAAPFGSSREWIDILCCMQSRSRTGRVNGTGSCGRLCWAAGRAAQGSPLAKPHLPRRGPLKCKRMTTKRSGGRSRWEGSGLGLAGFGVEPTGSRVAVKPSATGDARQFFEALELAGQPVEQT